MLSTGKGTGGDPAVDEYGRNMFLSTCCYVAGRCCDPDCCILKPCSGQDSRKTQHARGAMKHDRDTGHNLVLDCKS